MNAPKQPTAPPASVAEVWQPKLNCPTCSLRLADLEPAPPESTAVCPECGELLRSFAIVVVDEKRGGVSPCCGAKVRSYLAVRVYTDAEADELAHPEVLAKLRAIQERIRAAAICGCPKDEDGTPSMGDLCVCMGGCACHG